MYYDLCYFKILIIKNLNKIICLMIFLLLGSMSESRSQSHDNLSIRSHQLNLTRKIENGVISQSFQSNFFQKNYSFIFVFYQKQKNINNIRNEPFFSPLQSNIGKELYEAKVISSLTMLEIYIYRKYSKITLTKGSIF